MHQEFIIPGIVKTQREFYIRCEGPVFCANDLNEALTMWADNGRPVVKAVSSVG